MNQDEFSRSYDDLQAFYGARKNDAKKDIFWIRFRSFQVGAWEYACDAWMDAERTFPTPGALRPLIGRWVREREPQGLSGDIELRPVDRAFRSAYWPTFQKFLRKRATIEDAETSMKMIAVDLGLNPEDFNVQ